MTLVEWREVEGKEMEFLEVKGKKREVDWNWIKQIQTTKQKQTLQMQCTRSTHSSSLSLHSSYLLMIVTILEFSVAFPPILSPQGRDIPYIKRQLTN